MARNDFDIRDGVLYKYTGYSSSVVIPNGVTRISNAFEACTNLVSVVIPNSVTTIGNWAFGGCYNLTSVMVGSGIKVIKDYAFFGCTKLKSIKIPTGVTEIARTAFEKTCTIWRGECNTAAAYSTISKPSTVTKTAKTPASKPSASTNIGTTAKPVVSTPKPTTDKPKPKKTFTSINIPNQSTRLRMVKEYYSHPLRKEYENEKDKLHSKNPKRFIAYFIMAFPVVAFFGFGIEFLIVSWDGWMPGWHFLLAVINLLTGIFVIEFGAKLNTELKNDNTDIQELKQKYLDKGLYEVTEAELLSSKCGEYDSYYDDLVCSATREPLSYIDYNWCQTAGNCKYCRKFVQAYVGDTEHWSCEFKR